MTAASATILIVDDNPENLQLLFHTLCRDHYRVIVAEDGQSALERLTRHTVDLVLLDILMPEMDGFELYARLRAHPAGAGIPVIFLSALADRESVLRGLNLRAADYITKPFHPEEVLLRVARQLELQRLQRELETRNQALEAEITERRRIEEKLAGALASMERLAQQDGLTGLANRRYLDEYLLLEWQRLRREEASLGLILADVDHFKRYNDRLGHQAGDDALRAVAGALQGVLRRPADLAARYGGEEFALVLPHTELEGALVVAGALREAVTALALPHPDSDWPHISLSLGVVARVPRGDDPAPLLRAADAALYRAKAGGRNRIHEIPAS